MLFYNKLLILRNHRIKYQLTEMCKRKAQFSPFFIVGFPIKGSYHKKELCYSHLIHVRVIKHYSFCDVLMYPWCSAS